MTNYEASKRFVRCKYFCTTYVRTYVFPRKKRASGLVLPINEGYCTQCQPNLVRIEEDLLLATILSFSTVVTRPLQIRSNRLVNCTWFRNQLRTVGRNIFLVKRFLAPANHGNH